MTLQMLRRVAATLAVLCTGMSFFAGNVRAQVMDFSQIDAFEAMGTGTLRGSSPAKTVVDDDQRHTVFITILESDTEAKAYWKSLDGLPQTTIIHGPGVQAFQTAGEFKLEALGGESHSVKYGFLLLRLKKQ